MLTGKQVLAIRELRYQDGKTCEAVAAEVGCHSMTVHRIAPGRPGKIDNSLLRASFLASGLTAAEVARRAGWWDGTAGDSSRVKRTLGLYQDYSGSNGCRSTRHLIDAETAALLATAIGVMHHEVGCND